MRRCGRGDGLLHGSDVIRRVLGVAAQPRLDEDDAPARGRERRCLARAVHRADLGQARQPPLERGRGASGGRRVGRAHEDALERGLLEPGGIDAPVGAGGLAGAGLRVGERPGAGDRATGEARDDEREPHGDGELGPPRGGSGGAPDGAGERAVGGRCVGDGGGCSRHGRHGHSEGSPCLWRHTPSSGSPPHPAAGGCPHPDSPVSAQSSGPRGGKKVRAALLELPR